MEVSNFSSMAKLARPQGKCKKLPFWFPATQINSSISLTFALDAADLLFSWSLLLFFSVHIAWWYLYMVRREQGKFVQQNTPRAVETTHLQTTGSEPDENVSLFYDSIMKLSVRNMQSWGCIGWWLTVTQFCVGTHVTARVYSQPPLVQMFRLTRHESFRFDIQLQSHSGIYHHFDDFLFSFRLLQKKKIPLARVTLLMQGSVFHLHQ